MLLKAEYDRNMRINSVGALAHDDDKVLMAATPRAICGVKRTLILNAAQYMTL
jgi:hypothetical protein